MKEFHLKGSGRLLKIIYSFSVTEKVIFSVLVLTTLASSLFLAWRVNSFFLVAVPAQGGSFSEGMIGLPRSINPVLAFTDIDKDLSTLIYSGLMKYSNNKLVPDLASSYSVSEDGLVYSFKISDNLRFHDGTQLTTDDIEFTIQKIQDSEIKSPKRVDWASITIKKISSSEIQFILKQPYSPFLANTTVGIIPKNTWKNLTSDEFIFSKYNLEPIGSGPYKVKNIQKDKDGSPIFYDLSSFDKYNNGQALISNIKVFFYQSEEGVKSSFKNRIIDNIGSISPQLTSEIAGSSIPSKIIHNPLTRVFGVFFNQNNSPVLAYPEVRQALNIATDRNKIVKEAHYGYATTIDGPLTTDNKVVSFNKQAAKDILNKNGWTTNASGILEKKTKTGKQALEFTINTADSVDLKKTAEILKKDWEDLGAKVDVRVFEFGDLSQNIIKTRKYDALLFGAIINKNLDLYAFWHSSQRNSPGLNIAMYANSKIDKILEDFRITNDDKVKKDLNDNFSKIIKDDIPAIFLYSPDFIYVMSNKIKGYDRQGISNHSDRFYGIDKWYISTDNVWKIFVPDNENLEKNQK